MSYPFTGSVVFDVHLRLLGASITRQLRVNYQYSPSWPYLDPETGEEVTGMNEMRFDLEILARPRAEKLPRRRPEDREPYWTPARELLAIRVFNHRVYEELNVMIDSDAHIEDLIRRHKANPGAPSLPNVL